MVDDPIVRILIEAAARGRELRLARERAGIMAAEDAPDQESDFTAAMRQAAAASDEDHNFATA
jgi:hypothetical protein